MSHSNTAVDAHHENLDAHDPANVVNPEHVSHHIVSPAVYGMIFGVLMLGTLITVGASMLPLGVFNAPIAVAIACTKAVFVVLFFMHVKYSSRLVKLTVAAGFFTFFVLCMMCMLDYFTRAWGLW